MDAAMKGDWVVLWSEVHVHKVIDIKDRDMLITKCGLKGEVEKNCLPPVQETFLEYCIDCCIEEIRTLD